MKSWLPYILPIFRKTYPTRPKKLAILKKVGFLMHFRQTSSQACFFSFIHVNLKDSSNNRVSKNFEMQPINQIFGGLVSQNCNMWKKKLFGRFRLFFLESMVIEYHLSNFQRDLSKIKSPKFLKNSRL